MTKASDNQFPKIILTEQGSTPANPSAGDQKLFIRISDHRLCRLNSSGTVTVVESAGAGDVVGPSSAVDGHLVVFDGTTGKLVKDGGAVPTGSGNGYTAPPALSSFAWINQGIATATESAGGIHLCAPAAANDNLRVLKKAAPATPYKVTICFAYDFHYVNYARLGLCWRQSSDGKIITVEYGWSNALGRSSLKWNSATSFNGNYLSPTAAVAAANQYPMWMRMEDNGTSRIISYSPDGVNFYAEHTVGRTDFLTADEIGIFANSGQTTWPVSMTLLSWAVT